MLNFLTLATIAFAAPYANFIMKVESVDSRLNDKGVSVTNFGSNVGGSIITDYHDHYIMDIVHDYPYQCREDGNATVQFTLSESANMLVALPGDVNLPVVADKQGYLTINGSSRVFWACDKLTWDPYEIVSSDQKGVGVYGEGEIVPDVCSPIRIVFTTVY